MRTRVLASTLILAGVLAQPTLATAQVDSPTTDMRADRDDDSGKWGWLGLLGLVGLAGLRRRDRNDVSVRAPRTT
jgi:MYXO-CTERM domain-containing protein